MAKTRMINTKIWEDAWFNDLDPIEKLFFVYLLTNPMTNIIGAYELSKGTMGRATGLETRVVDEILNRFEKSEKVYFRDGWVVITNFIKHQNYRSPKILAGIDAELKNVPKNIVGLIKSPIKLYGIDTISHLNSNSNSNLNSNSNIIPSEKSDDKLIPEVINLFKEINPSYKKLFGSPPQRKATLRMIETHGFEKVSKVIGVLGKTNKMTYMPTITTPVQLEDKWASLESNLVKKKVASEEKKNYVL